jgi:hypothetical protein
LKGGKPNLQTTRSPSRNWKKEKEIEVVEELIMSYQQSIANGRVQSFCSESVERRFISDGTAPSG